MKEWWGWQRRSAARSGISSIDVFSSARGCQSDRKFFADSWLLDTLLLLEVSN